jgi:hypothetical protein
VVWYKSFLYQAASWKTARRVVAKVQFHWLMLAESHLTRRLFGAMVGRIAALPVPTR